MGQIQEKKVKYKMFAECINCTRQSGCLCSVQNFILWADLIRRQGRGGGSYVQVDLLNVAWELPDVCSMTDIWSPDHISIS